MISKNKKNNDDNNNHRRTMKNTNYEQEAETRDEIPVTEMGQHIHSPLIGRGQERPL